SAGHPIYLLEDSAYRELRFTDTDTPSTLTQPGAEERVIYTGTYSKPFATGIRAGYGILPEEICTVVSRIKGNHDFGTANLVQHVLSHALQTDKYERHLEQLRKRYARKAATMLAAMKTHFPETVTWPETKGGLYYWASAPKRTGLKSKFFQAALDAGVFYVPGPLCYADDPTRKKPDNEMRISFGAASEKNIRTGIRLLGGVLG
ncbi:MAG: aminotransferase class I/II-fold pyridoxal phosphate-dependent enzyme, partial [Limisphaerales bacterium]